MLKELSNKGEFRRMKNTIILITLSLILTIGISAQDADKERFTKEKSGFRMDTVIKEFVPPKKPKAENTEQDTQNTQQQSGDYIRPSKEKRFKRYVNSMVGPGALLRQGAGATLGTITNSPEEWGKDTEGFARRFASSAGQNAIKQTTTYALDEALELDSKYYKSKKKDFGSKMKNALLSTVTARNKEGKRVFGAPRIVGTYTSHIIAREAWYPDRFDYKDGLRSGTISLGVNAAFNVFREFVLD